ncbi:unnamed protein product [Caenorhabditis angaria]|uniref:Serpentine receptor class r-10 n=1 Tax=Caenorhabditis angaria TaxID=860376 RepID=A0A9P1ISQ8_9PELO|nr:unnamed protein product [Caenorhabditis angaria]
MFITAKTIFQISSTIMSLILNTALIVLIIKKSPVKMGNYRALMIYFSIFAMTFSLLDIWAKPFVHSIDHCFAVIVEVENLKIGKQGSLIVVSALCGCFGSTITCLAIHFAYRFFALERKGRLRFFTNSYLIFWSMLPIIFGISWGTMVYFLLGPSEQASNYLAKSIYDDYNLDIKNVTYVGALYFYRDNTPNIKHFLASSILMIIMFISFSIVFNFAIRSFVLIQKLLKNEGESKYSQNLQQQLYKALVFQSLFPLSLMYIPVGAYFIAPMFGINIETFSRVVTFLYAVYPAVDPIPIIFIIDDYRFAVFKLFHICENRNRVRDVEMYQEPQNNCEV